MQVQRLKQSTHAMHRTDDCRHEDFLLAAARVSPSVSADELQHYERLRVQFGSLSAPESRKGSNGDGAVGVRREDDGSRAVGAGNGGGGGNGEGGRGSIDSASSPSPPPAASTAKAAARSQKPQQRSGGEGRAEGEWAMEEVWSSLGHGKEG